MVITTLFEPGDTIWFVDNFTQLPESTIVVATKIDVDTLLAVTISYYVDINGITRYVNEEQSFASQADLAAYYAVA